MKYIKHLNNSNFIKYNDDKKNKYYLEASEELKELNINQYDIDTISNIIDTSYLRDTYIKIMKNFNTSILYSSHTHGINHNIRVSLFAYIISSIEKINTHDFELILEATKYHDIGRQDDNEDKAHGFESSKKLYFLNNIYTEEDMNYLKTIVTCHSIPDSDFEKIAKKNNIIDLEKCKRMYQILKDSDGLDRVRLKYPVIKLNYMRTDTSKKLILFAYDLNFNYEKIISKKNSD